MASTAPAVLPLGVPSVAQHESAQPSRDTIHDIIQAKRPADMAENRANLEIHLQPGAKKNEIVSLRDGVLWVRVTAPPLRGQANSALLALMAELLAVPKSAIAITRGYASRHKVIAIQGLSPENLKERLDQALSRKQPSQG